VTATGNPNYGAILSTTLQKWLERNFVDNVWKARVLFFMLNKQDNIRKIDGGESIMVPVLEGDNGTVMTYSQDEELRILRQKGMTTARFTWAQAAVSVTITGLEEAQNRGESKIIDLLGAKTEQAEESFAAFFNRTWFGTGPAGENTSALDTSVVWNNLTSFLDATNLTVGSITGRAAATPMQAANTLLDHTLAQTATQSGNVGATYPTSVAGVAGTADPGFGDSPAGFWLPVNATVAAPSAGGGAGRVDMVAGKKAMRTMYNTVSIGQDQPQAIITTQSVYEQYEDSLVDQIRYTNTEMADAGFQNLMFKACPITYDADQNTTTTHKMDFLNFRYLRVVGHSDNWFKSTPFVRPNNRDARTSQILCYGQLVVLKRSAQGRLAWSLSAS
jgi:hypothetical protein